MAKGKKTDHCISMQEMDSCDAEEDPDVDGILSDLDETVETQVNN